MGEEEEKRVGRGRRREWGRGRRREWGGEESRADAGMVCDGEVSGPFCLFLLL